MICFDYGSCCGSRGCHGGHHALKLLTEAVLWRHKYWNVIVRNLMIDCVNSPRVLRWKFVEFAPIFYNFCRKFKKKTRIFHVSITQTVIISLELDRFFVDIFCSSDTSSSSSIFIDCMISFAVWKMVDFSWTLSAWLSWAILNLEYSYVTFIVAWMRSGATKSSADFIQELIFIT